MKRKFVCLLITISILATGCGSTTTVELSNTEQSNEIQSSDTTEKENNQDSITEESNDTLDATVENNSEVSIILTMVSFDDTETINDYVLNLNEENNSNSYEVYDETHYTVTITESERQEVLKQYKSGELIEESFSEIFSDEQYNSAFIKMDYDELFQNITFYADKEKYDAAGIAVVFGPVLSSSIYSDLIQAYNLIPIDERTCTVKILDNQTNEIIYDSSKTE